LRKDSGVLDLMFVLGVVALFVGIGAFGKVLVRL